jgi:hypothetical protein
MYAPFTRPFTVTRLLFTLLAAWLMIPDSSSRGTTLTLNVTNFGARGDAVQILVSTVGNSTSVVFTKPVSSSDVGKAVEIFGAGPATSGTNNQDYVGIIQSASGSTATVTPAPSATGTFLATYGTDNSTPFQNCINAASGTNTIINIPAGTFLLLSPQVFSNFSMANAFETHPAITLTTGGLDITGAGETNTILLGCGAWQLKGAWVYRGFMFACQGPVSNDYPLIFENMTLDGGVQVGYTGNGGWPADTTTGDGWDVTHDAVFDISPTPIQSYRVFRNLHIRNWRGEQLKSGISLTDGFILITNCIISDGDASGFNFNFTHTTVNCIFSNLFQGEEFYEGYCTGTCLFANNLLTNISSHGLVINGAVSDHSPPPYIISNNVFASPSAANGTIGVATTPAQNVVIANNQFLDYTTAIGLGIAGYQGSAYGNTNILISSNVFNGCGNAVQVMGNGDNSVINATIEGNVMNQGGWFGYGYGWSTNVTFVNNVGIGLGGGGLNSTMLQGQWYLDDISNQFPPMSYNDYVNQSNIITYAWGARAMIIASKANSVFLIDDAHPQQIPPGAVLVISNSVNYAVPLFFSSTQPTTSILLTNGNATVCYWTNGAWQLASQVQVQPLLPPSDLHVVTTGP